MGLVWQPLDRVMDCATVLRLRMEDGDQRWVRFRPAEHAWVWGWSSGEIWSHNRAESGAGALQGSDSKDQRESLASRTRMSEETG